MSNKTISIAKPVILLVCGGESPEHSVSLASARNIHAAINRDRYDVVIGLIDHDGAWYRISSFDSNARDTLTLLPGKSAVVCRGETIAIDVIFPVLHGEGGEDGSIQGLASMLHTPVVGCGIAASAFCIDKALTKQLLTTAGIPIVPFEVYYTHQPQPNYDDLSVRLGRVLFIKPARLGSSVGVSKVASQAELDTALKTAQAYDNKILIEIAVEARELEVAVLGDAWQQRISAIGEITPDRDFYDFDAKYDAASTSRVTIPAAIPDETAKTIHDFAEQAYQAIGCEGLSRIDFFLDSAGAIYLNEINTMPGFTSISMYPKLWKYAGMDGRELVTELIELARHKHS